LPRPRATTQVVIVDDSLTVRTILKRMVESGEKMEVTGTASSAERAIALLRSSPAQVILLDLEMPGMGGLEALPAILKAGAGAQVLVVSSLTQDGAEHTVSALSMGAADTMLKPRPGGFNEEYRAQLLAKIRALGAGVDERAAVSPDDRVSSAAQVAAPSATRIAEHHHYPSPAPTCPRTPELIAIGASTGGIHALNVMLRALPPHFDLPILITQHLPASFIPVFARQIEMACARPAVIAEEGTEIRRGEVAIATGHGHMIVRRVANRLVAGISTEPARSGCLPSVDPMLASAAQACGGRVLAVMLSGMGRDGVEGAAELVELGGAVFAQDAQSSAVWGMPGAVSKAGLASYIAPPAALAAAIAAAIAAQTNRDATRSENTALRQA
jgi:two-component system chemotaxis response regulator CheB